MSEMPSHFETVCPKCLVGLRVPLSYSGCNVLCKYCEHKFRVFGPDHLVTPSHERSRLDEQYHQAREELESARSEIRVLQARLSELLDRHDQLKADHLEAIEAQRSGLGAEFQAELEAQRSRHAEQIAEHHARAEANAQLVERLKAEILTIAQSRSAADANLEAAREEIADLRAKLADTESTESTKRSMSSLLEGMGIRLH